MNDKRWNVLYAGLDINTFFVLKNEKDFNISATAYIDKFQIFSYNPVNYLFKIIYFLRTQNKLYWFEFILNKLWFISMPFSSGVFHKYKNFLYAISTSKINIVDLWKEEKSVTYIKEKNIDFILLSVWPILSGSVVLAPKYGSINIHPSMLPQYRGSLPTLWSLKNNDKESAVTYMIVDPTMDTGNIITQHAFPISPEDNWLSLEQKIAKIVENSLVPDIKNYLLGTIKLSSQNVTITSSKTETYNNYKKVNWEIENVQDIYNKINLYPFLDPNIYCYGYLENRKIYFKSVNMKKNTHNTSNFLNFPVKCKDGILNFRLFKDIDVIPSFSLILSKFKQFMR